jgi:hypothetical protein
MIPVVDKDIAGNDKQLATTLVTGQSIAAPVRGRYDVDRVTAVSRLDGTAWRRFGEFAHRSSIRSRQVRRPLSHPRSRTFYRNDITTRGVSPA